MTERTTTTIRIEKELFTRFMTKKKRYETWSAFLNRMIPEEKA